MNTIYKNRWQIRIAAAIIFLLGFTAGILALNVYRSWAREVSTPRDRFDQLSEQLKLTPDQKTQVQKIFSDTREQLRTLRQESEPKVNDIRKQADDRIQQVLNPDQWQEFQKARDEMRARRARNAGSKDQ